MHSHGNISWMPSSGAILSGFLYQSSFLCSGTLRQCRQTDSMTSLGSYLFYQVCVFVCLVVFRVCVKGLMARIGHTVYSRPQECQGHFSFPFPSTWAEIPFLVPSRGSASPTIHAPELGKSGVGRGGADDLLSSICGQNLTRTIPWLAYQKKDCYQKKRAR